METKFQTSFIPKKPLVPTGGVSATVGVPKPHTKHTINVFLDIALFLFIASLVSAGGVYAWKNISQSTQESYKQALDDRRKEFNHNLIEDLKRVNIKIDTAKSLLGRHIALSSVFGVISQFTVVNVRFIELDITMPSETSRDITLEMKGVGTNWPTVAYQSDVLGNLAPYGLNKVVKNPIISDPRADSAGVVSFGFKATLDPSTLIYAPQPTQPTP